MRPRRAPRWSTLLAAFALTACVDLEREAPEKMRYLLQAERTNGGPGASEHRLEVPPFHVAPAFATQSFVYRTRSGSFTMDFYHEFFTFPGENIAEVTRKWLRRSRLFETVHGGESRLPPTHVLEGDIARLFGDYAVDPPEARLTVRVYLLQLPGGELLLSKTYDGHEPIQEPESQRSIVEAWDEALRNFLQRLEADLALALAGSGTPSAAEPRIADR